MGSHSFTALSHTLFFSKVKKHFEELSKNCTFAVLRNGFLKSWMRDGMPLMGCMWMEPTRCQRVAPASYLLKFFQYL